ncbi:MAG: hypothetical protein LBG89_01545 [Rickettsiales bacterium]|nr:hypothetical protein [Rickettsiales bacterium]
MKIIPIIIAAASICLAAPSFADEPKSEADCPDNYFFYRQASGRTAVGKCAEACPAGRVCRQNDRLAVRIEKFEREAGVIISRLDEANAEAQPEIFDEYIERRSDFILEMRKDFDIDLSDAPDFAY